MKIAVWRTGHEIADTIAEAVYEGLKECGVSVVVAEGGTEAIGDMAIGYGILRNMDKVFRSYQEAKKPWFNIDRGYWKPGHYDGYYRVSLRGTQQTTGLDKLKPDYERWDALGLEILPVVEKRCGNLVCPPTPKVDKFFKVSPWFIESDNTDLWRFKDCERPLQKDLDNVAKVITFNSSVGWEALRQGIPVISDPTHSIVGAYQKMLDKDLSKDSKCRRDLFALMAGLQLRLDEIKSGALWPLLQTLLTIN